MAEGFRRIQGWKDTGLTTQVAFLKVFPGEWKASTFSDHNYVWKKTPADIMASTIATGRGPGGEWGALLSKYRKRKK
jgi:hypothetical protein